MRLESVFITVIVATVLVILFQEMSITFNQMEQWCHAHNGTIVSRNSEIVCEFPNGTVKEVPRRILRG